MRLDMQSAFVLHKRPYQDSSSIIELFTFEHGRISVLAKGARGARSKIRGLLQPFSPLVISTGGRGELAYLNKVECDGAPFLLAPEKLATGLYLNQLLIKHLAKHDPYPQLFLIYRKALKLLYQKESCQIIMRRFEFSLLEQMGYGISLEYDVNGNLIDESNYYYFVVEKGFMPTKSHHPQACLGKWLTAWRNKEYHHLKVQQLAEVTLRFALANI